MRNSIYHRTVTALSELLCSSPQDLDSGNGCRFVNSRRGKATVYHSNIAGGNKAEVAFQVESFSERLRLQGPELLTYFAQIFQVTGRTTNPDPTWNWPRVGVATDDDVISLIEHLRDRYAA